MRILKPSVKVFLLGFVAGGAAVVGIEALLVLNADLEVRNGFYACQGNINHVYLALYAFTEEHNGFLPRSLDELVTEGLIDARELQCPVSGKKYIYTVEGLRVKSMQLPPAYILVMEAGCPHVLLSRADPRASGEPIKQCLNYWGSWRYTFASYWWNLYEENPQVLRKVLGFPKELVPGPESEGPPLSGDSEQGSDGR